MTDAEPIGAADERQAKQFWRAFDAAQHLCIGELHVLKSSVDVLFRFVVEQSGQGKALDETVDFTSGHWLLFQINHVNGDAALFEETFSGASLLRVL